MIAMRLRMIALYGHARTSAHKSSAFENMSARIMRTEYTQRCIAAMPAVLAFLIALAAAPAEARIDRDRAQVRAFRAENPCPVTGRTRGACPGWEIDHAVPLCAGGADHPSNLQWLRKEDHRFKTLVDVKECRKLERAARRPAGEAAAPWAAASSYVELPP